jgi:hypothetical protein
MNSDKPAARSLRDIELEVLEEGREWTRRRLEQRLQQEADRQGGVFPPQRSKGTSPTKRGDESTYGRRSGEGGGVAGQRPDR